MKQKVNFNTSYYGVLYQFYVAAILIHFDKTTGAVEIEAQGFEGLSCLEATQPFEEALGVVKESDRTYKTEAEVRHSNRTTQSQQQRTRQ